MLAMSSSSSSFVSEMQQMQVCRCSRLRRRVGRPPLEAGGNGWSGGVDTRLVSREGAVAGPGRRADRSAVIRSTKPTASTSPAFIDPPNVSKSHDIANPPPLPQPSILLSPPDPVEPVIKCGSLLSPRVQTSGLRDDSLGSLTGLDRMAECFFLTSSTFCWIKSMLPRISST